MQRVWDISPAIGPGFPVFPGDSEFSQRWTWTLSSDCPVNVSEITLSPHTGSHTDAPLHYDAGGKSIAEVPEGDYELIALPLKIAGCDASPVRAVLRELA